MGVATPLLIAPASGGDAITTLYRSGPKYLSRDERAVLNRLVREGDARLDAACAVFERNPDKVEFFDTLHRIARSHLSLSPGELRSNHFRSSGINVAAEKRKHAWGDVQSSASHDLQRRNGNRKENGNHGGSSRDTVHTSSRSKSIYTFKSPSPVAGGPNCNPDVLRMLDEVQKHDLLSDSDTLVVAHLAIHTDLISDVYDTFLQQQDMDDLVDQWSQIALKWRKGSGIYGEAFSWFENLRSSGALSMLEVFWCQYLIVKNHRELFHVYERAKKRNVNDKHAVLLIRLALDAVRHVTTLPLPPSPDLTDVLPLLSAASPIDGGGGHVSSPAPISSSRGKQQQKDSSDTHGVIFDPFIASLHEASQSSTPADRVSLVSAALTEAPDMPDLDYDGDAADTLSFLLFSLQEQGALTPEAYLHLFDLASTMDVSLYASWSIFLGDMSTAERGQSICLSRFLPIAWVEFWETLCTILRKTSHDVSRYSNIVYTLWHEELLSECERTYLYSLIRKEDEELMEVFFEFEGIGDRKQLIVELTRIATKWRSHISYSAALDAAMDLFEEGQISSDQTQALELLFYDNDDEVSKTVRAHDGASEETKWKAVCLSLLRRIDIEQYKAKKRGRFVIKVAADMLDSMEISIAQHEYLNQLGESASHPVLLAVLGMSPFLVSLLLLPFLFLSSPTLLSVRYSSIMCLSILSHSHSHSHSLSLTLTLSLILPPSRYSVYIRPDCSRV